MSKTLIDIPDDLMEQARQLTGGSTKAETVRAALRLLVRQHQQHDAIAWIAESAPFRADVESERTEEQ